MRVVPIRGTAGVEADFTAATDWQRFRIQFNGGPLTITVNGAAGKKFLFSDAQPFDTAKFDFSRPLAQARRITIRIVSERAFNLRNFFLLKHPAPGEIHHHIDSRRRALAPIRRTHQYGTPVSTLTRVGQHVESVLWTIERGIAPEYILHRSFEFEDSERHLAEFHPVAIIDA